MRIGFFFAAIFVTLLSTSSQRLVAASDSWENGIAVQLRASRIELLTVRSTWASDYDFAPFLCAEFLSF